MSDTTTNVIFSGIETEGVKVQIQLARIHLAQFFV